MNLVTSVLSGIRKTIDNGKAYSANDDEMKRTFFNVFKIIFSAKRRATNPNDELSQKVFDYIDATIGLATNDEESDEDKIKTMINQLGTLGSVLQKKANPKNEFITQLILSFIDIIVSVAKNEIGGGQEVHADSVPMYTAKRFDQSMLLKSVDEKAAMVETDMDLTDEAKTKQWGTILSSLATGMLDG